MRPQSSKNGSPCQVSFSCLHRGDLANYWGSFRGHLYRYHLIHQCQRCKGLFDSEEELDSHIETSDRCDAILAPPVDGITRKMKAVLQSKRKAFPGQTEAERWKQIYQLLFPDDEEVPDPCKS